MERTIATVQSVLNTKPDVLKSAITSFWHKLIAGDSYKPSGKFSGPVSLVRAKDNFINLGEDYGLNEVN